MDHIQIELLYKPPEEFAEPEIPEPSKITIPLSNAVNYLTPEVLSKNHPNLDLQKLYGFNAYVEANMLQTLIIAEFDYFSIFRYRNSSPKLNHIKVYNIRHFCRINGFEVGRIDIEYSTAMVIKSVVKDLYFAIEKNNKDDPYDRKYHQTLELHDNSIDKIRVYAETKRIEIQKSQINSFEINYSCEDLHVWQSSDINRLFIMNHFSKFTIDDSNINILYASSKTKINTFMMNSSRIESVPRFESDYIIEKNNDSYLLIKNSYKEQGQVAKYGDAAYEHESLRTKLERNILLKSLYLFIKWTCGFGYKPFRTIFGSMATVCLFTVIYSFPKNISGDEYSLVKLDNSQIFFPNNFLFAFLFSIESFLGFSSTQVKPASVLISFATGCEAFLGLIFFSLLIYSLTKRFSE
ncbi:hypothetical protein [Leptospira stimsonii]|uniref:Uncharacterized protein n=1 Tax=Leptospira stimsonii TaxID=2202203 RepID=A0A396YLK8_9LEPT|nr:hypothetical protein [Leptospira stimsonii]RHX83625.1 hypothetical protein DLM75_23860 [Leptospira stimsonii]